MSKSSETLPLFRFRSLGLGWSFLYGAKMDTNKMNMRWEGGGNRTCTLSPKILRFFVLFCYFAVNLTCNVTMLQGDRDCGEDSSTWLHEDWSGSGLEPAAPPHPRGCSPTAHEGVHFCLQPGPLQWRVSADEKEDAYIVMLHACTGCRVVLFCQKHLVFFCCIRV